MKKPTSLSNYSEQSIPLPSPGPGTSRSMTVLRYGNAGSHPKIYLQTALHADEIPGIVVVHHLRKLLDAAVSEGKFLGEIVLVPVANPIGMSQRIQGMLAGRLDQNDGKNYNRHFPDLFPDVKNKIAHLLGDDPENNIQTIRTAIAEEVSALPDASESDAYRKILLSLSYDADYCIDLHCDNEAVLYLYTGGTHPEKESDLCAFLQCQLHLVDSNTTQCFDGSISLLWKRLAKAFPDNPIPPSCLGSTIELRGKTDVCDSQAKLDANNLYQYLIHQGAIEGPAQKPPKLKCPATPLESQLYIKSTQCGVVLFHKQCGDTVAKGETVAEILDPLKSPHLARTSLKSEIAGTVIYRTDQRLVGPGQNITAIVGNEIIEDQIGKHLLSD